MLSETDRLADVEAVTVTLCDTLLVGELVGVGLTLGLVDGDGDTHENSTLAGVPDDDVVPFPS